MFREREERFVYGRCQLLTLGLYSVDNKTKCEFGELVE